MKYLVQLSILALILSFNSVLFSQSKKQIDCAFLKNSKMMNISMPNGGYVVFQDSIHMEYVDNGKYYIKSKLEWISDCEYNATVIKFTWPEFVFPIGEVLNCKVTEIKNDTLFFDLRLRDIKMQQKYKLIK
jgi:hypothetical protein